jgi:hypothetical protein
MLNAFRGRLRAGTSLLRSAALLFCLSVSVGAQATGTITGVVVDGNGDPVPHARVRLAEDMRAMDLSKTFPAGDDGRFVISNVRWGTYTVQAMKPEDGYPDPFVLIYRYHVSQPTVTVAAATPTAEVTVPIGPKAGSLLVRAVDGATGKELGPATLTLRRRDDPRVAIQLEAASDAVLVPAAAPLMIAVHVDGYADWYYPGVGPQALAKPLTLGAGEEKSLDIKLAPLPK